MDCCEIPSYLSSFPETWRKELSDVLCMMFQPTADNFNCDVVRGCETLTAVTQFILSPSNVLTLKYRDEKNITNTFTVNLTGLIPATVTADNGLTKTLNNIQLGGTLIKDTEIVLDGYEFRLTGEEIIFTDYPNTREDPDPINFLFTTAGGQVQSGNLQDAVEGIVNTYLNTIFNVALGAQTGCLPDDWDTLTLEEKMAALMDTIKQLCDCCETTSGNCDFTAAAIKVS